MTLPADRGAGGTPGLAGAGVGCGLGVGTGVGVGEGVSVDEGIGQGVRAGEGMEVGVACRVPPVWPGAGLAPQAAIMINRAPMSSSAANRSSFAYMVSSSFAGAFPNLEYFFHFLCLLAA